MRLFLRWLFGNFQIAATEEPPKLKLQLGRYVIYFKSPFRLFWPDGPSVHAYKYYHDYLHKNLHRFECKVCGTGVWGWGQRDHCGKWSCYRRLYGH